MEVIIPLLLIFFLAAFAVLIFFVGYRVDLFFRKLLFKLHPLSSNASLDNANKNSVVLFEWSINFSTIESRLIINGLRSFLVIFVFSIFLTTLMFGFNDLTPLKILIILVTSSFIILITYLGVFLRGKFIPKTLSHYFTYKITPEGIFQTNTVNPIVFKRNSYTNLFVPFTKLQNPKFVDSKHLVIFKRSRFFRFYLFCNPDNYQRVSEYIKGIYDVGKQV
ncbi:MAG: hypothetical protein J5I47_06000 [Vicingus serpentipes]|nr:hypothetical protein [Vicingus serpentipes]